MLARAVALASIAGIHLQDILEGVDGLLRDLLVVWRISARNILLRIRGSQVQARVEQGWIKAYGLFKVHDSGLELRVTVSLHSLIKVVARLQPVATAGSKRQQQHPTERGEFVEFHQGSSVDGSK